MASSGNRCLYEVLGLTKDCSSEEIRSAYRRLALQRHPDKLVKSGGLSEAEATAQFQELLHSYEVLSDPKERAWYDSHRSQILFADQGSGISKSSGMPSSIPDLFSFFSNTVFSGYSDTGKGFYKVYSDLFCTIYLNEINFVKKLGLRFDSVREAPIMGNLESPYGQVTAFYNYWLGFITVMDFCWVDQYDVMAGPNRKSRRLMEENNKKLRRKAKREYNETVRGLAEFVKKRDKRVIDMTVKRNAEMEKKKEEERERRKKIEKERMERLRNYEEPEWTKIQEEEEENEERTNVFEEDDSDGKKDEGQELYCVVCSKKFKSEKQWKNHEQSKKHRDKVAELRESFSDELDERGQAEEEGINGFEELSENVDEVGEMFEEGLKIEEAEGEEEEKVIVEPDDQGSEEESGSFDVEEGENEAGEVHDDDEMSVLKTMVSGHKNRRKNASSRDEAEFLKAEVRVESDETEFNEYDNRMNTRKNRKSRKERGKKNGNRKMEESTFEPFVGNGTNEKTSETEVLCAEVGVENDEAEFMENDKRKSTKRTRKGKMEKGKRNGGGAMVGDVNEIKSPGEDSKRNVNGHMEESTSEASVGNEYIEKAAEQNEKASFRSHGTSTKSKKSSKGKKAKAAAKNTGNMCDRCGEEFESRNKLQKHLDESGHATIKSR